MAKVSKRKPVTVIRTKADIIFYVYGQEVWRIMNLYKDCGYTDEDLVSMILQYDLEADVKRLECAVAVFKEALEDKEDELSTAKMNCRAVTQWLKDKNVAAKSERPIVVASQT